MSKRIGFIVLVLFIILSISIAYAETEVDLPTSAVTPAPTPDVAVYEFVFRDGIKFGMTMQEVLELEEVEPAYSMDGAILYDGVIAAGKEAEVCYLFEDDALIQIGVIFAESHTNENLYINDFEDVDDSLCAKYGEPVRDSQQFWSANTYKNDPDRWGFAVSIGDLAYGTEYMPNNYPNLWIKHILQGDNYEFTHMISYEYFDGTEEHTYNTDGI